MPYMIRAPSTGQTLTVNALNTFAIPREHFINKVWLRTQLATSGGATPTYGVNAVSMIYVRVEVIANGQVIIKSFPKISSGTATANSNTINFANWAKYGVMPLQLGVFRGDAATGTTGEIWNSLDFAVEYPDVTSILPSHLLSSLDLKLTTDTAANLSATGTNTYSSTLDFYTLELINQGQDASSAILNKETVLSKAPTTTGFTEFDLPLGNVYKSLVILAEGGATGTGFRSDAITDVEVVQDGVVYHRKTNQVQLTAGAWDGQIGVGASSQGTTVLDQGGLSLGLVSANTHGMTATVQGMLPIDFAITSMGGGIRDNTGDPTSLLRALPHLPDSSRMASWKLRTNIASTSNTNGVDVILQELVMPKAQRA